MECLIRTHIFSFQMSITYGSLLATVVELNQSSREKFTNIINLGIWLHSSKPKNEMMNGTKPKALWT